MVSSGESGLSDRSLTTVSVIDADGTIKLAGQGLERYGDATDGTIRRTAFDSVVDADRASVWKLLETVVGGEQKSAAITVRVQRGDGAIRFAELHLIDHRSDPLIEGVLLVSRDVTREREDAEALDQLRQIDRFLGEAARTIATVERAQLPAAMDAIVRQAGALLGVRLLTLSTGQLRVSDPGSLDPEAYDDFTTIYRWSAPDVIAPHPQFRVRGFGVELAEWFNGPRPPRWIDVDRLSDRLRRTGHEEPAIMGDELVLYAVKLPTDQWGVLGAWDPVHREAAEFMISGLADIWAVVEARTFKDKERRRSAIRFETLLAHSSDLLMVHNRKLVVTYVSPGAKSLLDIDPSSVVGHSLMEFLHPDDLESITQISLKPRIASDPRVVRVRAADGSYRTFEFVATNLLSDPNVAGIVVNGRDVTDLALVKDALRRRRSLEQLVRRISTTFAMAPVDMTDELLQSCLVDLTAFTKATCAYVFVPEPGSENMVVRQHVNMDSASSNDARIQLTAEQIASFGQSFAAGAVYVQYRAHGDRRMIDAIEYSHSSSGRITGLVAIPLKSGEELVGVMVLSSNRESWECQSEYLGLLRTIGEIGAGALMRQRVERTLAEGALYDPLTGLPNRRMLMSKLTATLSRETTGLPVAVMFVDCDEFKAVNDTLGHEQGDRLLVQMARRLEAACAHVATLARFGGDEFVVMIDSDIAETAIVELAERIVTTLSDVYDLASTLVHVTVSVGVAIHPPHGTRTDTSSLLRRADVAMYQAKQAGRNGFHVYSEALESSTRARFNLLSDLRRAIETSDQFDVWYQPVYAISGDRTASGPQLLPAEREFPVDGPFGLDGVAPLLAGYEALVRWRHPTKGLVLPAGFIDLAEDSGVINELGWYVLETAVQQLMSWRTEGRVGERVGMAVNVSVRQLQSSRLMQRITSLLTNAALPPELLTIEITESVLADRGNVLSELMKLRSLGLRIAIDDFGTGYSSLAYLRDFPVDVLKVDRSFVGKLGSDRRENAMVAMMCQLAEQLGIPTVAEGIETPRQLDIVRSLGCDFGQGFLLGRPATASEIHEPTIGALLASASTR